MLTHKTGDIFTSTLQTIVNPVNCVGVMGKGLALSFKNKYPTMYKSYKLICAKGMLSIGLLSIHATPRCNILNFPTKTHWREPSRMEYIEAGLIKFVDTYKAKGVLSIAFPLLGVGCGGLNANTVVALMELYLDDLDIPVEVWTYE